MNSPDAPHPQSAEGTEEILRRLEARLARIETYLQLSPLGEAEIKAFRERIEAPISAGRESAEEKEAALERTIGEFWLARMGIVALLIGTAFFIAYPIAVLPPLLHSLVGYLAVAGLFFFSHVWRAAYPYLSRILFGGGLILLFYATLRLHFFSDYPVIANKAMALAGLIAVVGLHFYFAAQRKSELLTGIAVFLGCTTALMGDATHFTLPRIAVTSAAAVYFLLQYRFQTVVLLSVVLACLTHLLWLLGNPTAVLAAGSLANAQIEGRFGFEYNEAQPWTHPKHDLLLGKLAKAGERGDINVNVLAGGWFGMQPLPSDPIKFTETDSIVKLFGRHGFSLAWNLLPNAPWAYPNKPDCQPDTILGIPIYTKHCAPKPPSEQLWIDYVKAVVERYDSDGVNDMPGLLRPVRTYIMTGEIKFGMTGKGDQEKAHSGTTAWTICCTCIASLAPRSTQPTLRAIPN